MTDKWVHIAINGQFREVEWKRMSPNERRTACQQLENHLAQERGALPRRILSIPMEGRTYGYQSGKCIYINSYILDANAFHTQNGFKTIPACGWQIYDTICHEDLHGMQEDLGTGQTFTYVSPSKNYDVYRIQHDEKYAYAIGQYRTLCAILEQKELYGLEPDMIAYKNEAKKDRYQDKVEEAAKELGIPNIDKELDQLIADKENGVVPQAPSNGYLQLDNILYGAHHNIEPIGENEGGHGKALINQGVSVISNETPVYEAPRVSRNGSNNHLIFGTERQEEVISPESHSYQALMTANEKESTGESMMMSYNQIAYGTSHQEEGASQQPLSYQASITANEKESAGESRIMSYSQVAYGTNQSEEGVEQQALNKAPEFATDKELSNELQNTSYNEKVNTVIQNEGMH